MRAPCMPYAKSFGLHGGLRVPRGLQRSPEDGTHHKRDDAVSIGSDRIRLLANKHRKCLQRLLGHLHGKENVS